MTEALLAGEQNQDENATTTQGGDAHVDTLPVAEEKQEQTDAEAKPEGEKPAGETKAKAEPKSEPEGPPENYTFEVPRGMPEGFEIDDAVKESLSKASRDLELSQANAQKLVDEVLPVIHRRSEEQAAALHDKWIAETKSDREIGGTALEKNLAEAQKAVGAYGSDGLRELLKSPFGSHPEVVRFLVKVGQTVSEDKFVGGDSRGESVDLNDDHAVAKKLYPKSLS